MSKAKDTVSDAPDLTAAAPTQATGAGTDTIKVDASTAADSVTGLGGLPDPLAVKPADTKAGPGSPDFDVESASQADFDKHYEILERRAKIAALSTPAAAQVAPAAAPVLTPAAPIQPAPGDIRVVHKDTGEVRYFTPETWAILGTTTAGWEVAVDKPEVL